MRKNQNWPNLLIFIIFDEIKSILVKIENFKDRLTHILPLSLYEDGKTMLYSRPSILKAVEN